ncbi:MAG TPA: hypothetical protein VF650_02815 [Allosphingosinicella sp.]|jgi:hypothetical protein
MIISALGPKSVLAGLVLTLFAVSMLLQFTNRGAIVPLFIASILATIWFRSNIVSAMSFTGFSRDVSILVALLVVTLAACHIHTIEIVYGLGKAALSAVYQSGVFLGTALARL